jgi:hypothetical protein
MLLLVIFDYNVAPSIHGPFPSSLTLFSPYNFNPSNPNHEDVIMSLNEFSPTLE